jgi:2-hydroxycyclohexanecarboxyl-CoA dehydrogenase
MNTGIPASQAVPNNVSYFSGRTAFITGGASGIGLGIAEALVAVGVKTAIADVNQESLEQAVQALRAAGGTVLGLQLDVRDRSGWREAADSAESVLGPVSILCNNAGVTGYTPLVETSPDYWDWIIGVNLTGTFNGVHTFGPRMIERGQGGHILNTASTAGLYAIRNSTVGAYVASKFGQVGLTEALRPEMAAHGIGVSVLCPGLVTTEIGPNVMRLRPDAATVLQKPLTPTQKKLRERSRQFGMAPIKVGQRVVQGILANELYIITHPEFREMVEQRHSNLLDHFGVSADPDLPLNPDWRELV